MFRNVSIIGDGAMGTVLAMLLAEKHIPVRMWGYDARQLADIERSRENTKFLPGHAIPKSVVFEPQDDRIMQGAEVVISAVPCQYMREIWMRLRSHFPGTLPLVSVAKGIENDTLMRPTEVLPVFGVRS
jgi:glycerol-3-phosphate dehydrogenase (NAD(P)+)